MLHFEHIGATSLDQPFTVLVTEAICLVDSSLIPTLVKVCKSLLLFSLPWPLKDAHYSFKTCWIDVHVFSLNPSRGVFTPGRICNKLICFGEYIFMGGYFCRSGSFKWPGGDHEVFKSPGGRQAVDAGLCVCGLVRTSRSIGRCAVKALG